MVNVTAESELADIWIPKNVFVAYCGSTDEVEKTGTCDTRRLNVLSVV